LAVDINIPKPTENEVNEAMKVIDSNKDGKINFEEYKVTQYICIKHFKEIY